MIRRALAAAAILALAPLPAAADEVDDIHEATNAERAKHGLAPLARSRCLDAQGWSAHLAYEGRLQHSDTGRLMADCGLTAAAENIAFNVPAGELVAEWMASPGHRANILGPYTSMGVGMDGAYAVQQFGTGGEPAPATRSPSPAPSGLASTGGEA